MIPLYDDNPTRRFPVVTIALILANAAVFAFELTLPAHGITTDGFFYRLGMIPYEIVHQVDIPPRDLVPWELTPLTAMFIHGGWLHIIFNMLFLWIFGNNVEDAMGRLRFFVFYMVCGLVAALAQAVVSAGSTAPTIGASGAIAGVLGAYIVLYPRARVLTLAFIIVLWVPAWLLLGFWFGLQFLSGVAAIGATGGIAYAAHVGGFLAGVVLVFVFTGRRLRELRRARRLPAPGSGYRGWDGDPR